MQPRLYVPTFLTIPTKSKGTQSTTFGDGFVAGVARKLSANRLRGFTLDFLFGFTSIAFSVFVYDHRAAEV